MDERTANPFEKNPRIPLRPGVIHCQAHTIWLDQKPCASVSTHSSTEGNKPILLCDYHMWRIGLAAKKRQTIREVTVTKTRRTTIRMSDHERTKLERSIKMLQETVDSQRRTIDALVSSRARGPRDPKEQGTVYYLRIGGYYKIGWASDLDKRMRSYYPDTQLLAAHPGTRADEKDLHKRWKHLLAYGNEWFTLAPEIGRHIDQMIEKYGEPEDVRFSASPRNKPPMPHRLNTTGPRPRSWTA